MSTDDPIATLLAGLAPTMFLGNPAGTRAIMEERIIAAGGDVDEVHAWVQARGGYRDRSFGVTTVKGFGLRPKPPSRQFYVVPESALPPSS